MQYYHAIGLMSGTSLDGLDMIYVRFQQTEHWNFKIIHCKTLSYDATWKKRLQEAIHLSGLDLMQLNADYGKFLGEKTQEFITDYQIDTLDLIASHGHTVFHQPQKGFTLQIGDGRWISEITKQKVVYDFRSQDVALGGQGAPLVPIGDALLFSNYDYCLNLGGFSNISYQHNNQRIAYDICAVNTVLNTLCNRLNLEYDEGGKIAQNGVINSELLQKLNDLDYYKQAAPKSLGIEYVNQFIFPLLESSAESTENQIATFTEHIAVQIAKVVHPKTQLLITGGGAFNHFLIEKIKEKSECECIVPNADIINYKEALIFAFLGVLRNLNQINVLRSVTGASNNHSSGLIVNSF